VMSTNPESHGSHSVGQERGLGEDLAREGGVGLRAIGSRPAQRWVRWRDQRATGPALRTAETTCRIACVEVAACSWSATSDS
jgi:hypothetical protein